VAGFAKGDTILTVINDPANAREASRFASFARCYELGSGMMPGESTNLVAMSRVTTGADGKPVPLPLDKVMLIDGEKFALSGEGIGSNPAGDDKVFLTRLKGDKRVPRLSRRPASTCKSAVERVATVALESGGSIEVVVPSDPNDASRPIYLGNDIVAIYRGNKLHQVPVIMEVTFRSPEGLFRYLGSYLENDKGTILIFDGHPLFHINDGRDRNALVQARYRGKDYSLVNDPATGTRNAQIFTLLQQLINLHKEATDRPTVIPVRAIP
jgi:hypothetical protein